MSTTTSADALPQLDDGYARWAADKPMVTLIRHIHREAIHHGAEIALLRDLYGRCGVRGEGIAVASE